MVDLVGITVSKNIGFTNGVVVGWLESLKDGSNDGTSVGVMVG